MHHDRPTRTIAPLLSVLLVVAGPTLVACSSGRAQSAGSVQTVAPPRTVTRAATPGPPEASTAPPAPEPPQPAGRDGGGRSGGAGGEVAAFAVVDQVLAAYGQVLGTLSADPAGAPAAGTPARLRWDAAVVPGSLLSDEVLDRVHRRATQERTVVLAGPDGVSFRHHPVELLEVTDDSIDFRWCGWSPGVGHSIDTGEVVDDLVAHAGGEGRAVRSGDTWRLDSLEQTELVVLPPGSADPCPAAPGEVGP